MKENKLQEFINLRQGSMGVNEYLLKFIQWLKYALTMVVDSRSRISKFVSKVSEMMVKECRTTMLIKDIGISRLMIHVQQIEEEKLKDKARESKGERTCDGDFSHSRYSVHGHSQFHQNFSDQN